MRVLIIKLTSMGDLMHAFPALSDAVKQYPDITFDWVVDEGFMEVPLWHPSVKRVITTAHRRWKKNLFQCWKRGELHAFYRQLNLNAYDVVVDLQSNLKSAIVSWLRRTPVHGYNKHTCREKPAHWAYDTHYHIELRQHAIERQRELMAKVLGYEKPASLPNYGVNISQCQLPSFKLPEKYVVFVHNASKPTKLWPVDYWQQLIRQVSHQDYSVLLPCGNDSEYQRAQLIAKDHPAAIALPKVSLGEMAAVMSQAKVAVCSDTGLAHMAAVLSIPAITLYAVTDTMLIGTVGQHQQHIIADKHSLNANMKAISADEVWNLLKPLL
ncbi:lipopolysaccharide heptosyltransferase I [Candidatus Endobugula sertula]|uniref:Lipopolysaccharide heptosyltransferase 1 n=1 Tax=Candidatus Endobugula sertula TaxID=62101 RepID=A0A1D2QSG6_9GAMM|nr:lipopolysaccharide heptosyltransferase I [Candidatus Endobugula sertula]